MIVTKRKTRKREMKNLGYYNGHRDEMEKMFIPMGDRVCFFGDGDLREVSHIR